MPDRIQSATVQDCGSFRRRFALAGAFLIWLVASSSCGQQEEPNEHERAANVDLSDRPLGPGEIIPADNVYWVSAEAVASAAIEPDALTFYAPHLEEVQPRQAGDILVTDAGEGFWRHIVSVEHHEDSIRLVTRDATLTEVIRHGDIEVEFASSRAGKPDQDFMTRRARLTGLNARPVIQDTVVVDDGNGGLPNSDEQVVGSLDLSKNLSGDDRFEISTERFSARVADGSLGLTPAIRLKLQIRDGILVYESLRASGQSSLDVLWDLEVDGDFSYQRAFRVDAVGEEVARIFSRYSPYYQPVRQPVGGELVQASQTQQLVVYGDNVDPEDVEYILNRDTSLNVSLAPAGSQSQEMPQVVNGSDWSSGEGTCARTTSAAPIVGACTDGCGSTCNTGSSLSYGPFPTVAGETYSVSPRVADYKHNCNETLRLQVYVNGALHTTWDGSGANAWAEPDFTFTATSDQTKVMFKMANDACCGCSGTCNSSCHPLAGDLNMYIDKVAIEPVSPGAIAAGNSGQALEMTISFQGRERTYTHLTEYRSWDNTSGLRMEHFARWLNDNFGDLGVSARVSSNLSGSTLTVTVATGNFLMFRLLGKRFTIEPEIIVRYEASGGGQGKVRTGFFGDGYVMAGYECSAQSGCRPLRRTVQGNEFTADEHHNVQEGAPRIDFRAYLEAGIKVRENGSDYAKLAPLAVDFNSSTVINIPYCPYELTSLLRSTATKLGRTYECERRSLFDVSNVVQSIQGCGMGSPQDDTFCTDDGDCAEGMVCMYPGNKCVDDSAMRVTLSWLKHDIDLDLYVQTPDGKVLSASKQVLPNGAEMTHISVGAPLCEGEDGCGGHCEGNLSLNCQEQTPAGSNCPLSCTFVPGTQADAPEVCGGEQVAACADVPGFWRHTGQHCPDGCAKNCVRIFGSLEYCACSGIYTEASCTDYSNQGTCNSESGCMWSTDQPGDTCWGETLQACSDVPQFSLWEGNLCPSACSRKCTWPFLNCRCEGTVYSDYCTSYSESECENNPGCNWGKQFTLPPPEPDRCDGGVITCGDLTKTPCQSRSECEWIEPPMETPPFIESAMFPMIREGDVYRVWVVNNSGSPDLAVTPYTLHFNVRDREDFELRGDVEFGANSRSVFFDYKVPPVGGRPDDGQCVPDFDSVLCANEGVECGMINSPVVDNCGNTRTGVYCGQCSSLRCEDLQPVNETCPFTCSYAYDNVTNDAGQTVRANERCEGGMVQIPCQNNVCQCGVESDADLCNLYGFDCGTATVTDSCGTTKTVNCGGCSGGVECSQQNKCCQPRTDAEICADYNEFEPVIDADGNIVPGQERLVNVACGTFSVVDECGNSRTVDCGNNCSTLNGEYRVQGPYFACSGNILQVREKVENRSYSCGERTMCVYSETPVENWTEKVINPSHTNCADLSYYTEWSECADFEEPCGETGSQWRYFYEYTCQQDSDTAGGCGFNRRVRETRACYRDTDGDACGAAYHQCQSEECVCVSPSNGELCVGAGRICGTFSTTDPCTGETRNVSCGGCPGSQVCSAQGACCNTGHDGEVIDCVQVQ